MAEEPPRLDKELVENIEIRPGVGLGIYNRVQMGAQRSSEYREMVGVELVGGQLRYDDEIVQRDADPHICLAQPIVSYLTSKPYPIGWVEGMDTAALDWRNALLTKATVEALDTPALTFLFASLRDPLAAYEMVPEAMETSGLSFLSAEIKQVFQEYTMVSEALDTSELAFLSAEIKAQLIVYSNDLPEAMETSGLTFLSATLS